MTPTQIAYREYLTSDHWRALRLAAFRMWGRKCFKCPRKFGLEVHHLFYRTRWEDSLPEDLRPCCWECHDKEHGLAPAVIPVQEKRTIERRIRKKHRKNKGWTWQKERLRMRHIQEAMQSGKKLTGKQKKFKKFIERTSRFSRPSWGKRPHWVSRGNSSN